jgi:hypothetical protein
MDEIDNNNLVALMIYISPISKNNTHMGFTVSKNDFITFLKKVGKYSIYSLVPHHHSPLLGAILRQFQLFPFLLLS